MRDRKRETLEHSSKLALVWFEKLQNCGEDLAKIQKSTDPRHTWYPCHFLATTNKHCSMKHCTCQKSPRFTVTSDSGAHNCQHGLEINPKVFEKSSPAGVLKHPLWIRHIASGAPCLRSACPCQEADSSASCRYLCRQPPGNSMQFSHKRYCVIFPPSRWICNSIQN